MKAVFVLAVLSAAAIGVLATDGIDASQGGCDSSCFSCIVNPPNPQNFAIIRGYCSDGTVDPNVVSTVAAAWAGGMSHVDVYMFPCPTCGDPAGQVSAAVSNLASNGVQYGMLWFDIEGPAYWMDQGSNQAFFNGLVSQAQAMGVTIGVYTSESQWSPIMGDGFTAGSAFPIWYAHYDNDPSFDDWSPFAGWSSPAIKQYEGTDTSCGYGVDRDWYPDGSRETWPLKWPAAFNVTKPVNIVS